MKKPIPLFEPNYHSATLNVNVHFSAEVLAHFATHRHYGSIQTELGGQLFARFRGNVVNVVRATGPNTTDKRGWAWFKPDQNRQNSEIKCLFKRNIHFVGDWHTHPESKPKPSSLDFNSMNDSVSKSRHQLKAFLLVIVGRAEFPSGLWVSLHEPNQWEQLSIVDQLNLVKQNRRET